MQAAGDGGDPEGDPFDSLDNLKDFHEEVIESLVSDNDDNDTDAELFGAAAAAALSASSPAVSGSGKSSSSAFTTGSSRSTHSFSSIQPQFNLDSATSLLSSFVQDMLPYFPVLSLPPSSSHNNATSVPALAKERPFVLLAILAAASSVRSLQGHSLYDEEFRKVLGLKFVSGGERSLELLLGLLIYCAWYPFHLRPRNRQAQQYIRMAGDIVRDLDMDEPPAPLPMEEVGVVDVVEETRKDEERMAHIRAYLACYYLSSVFASTFQKKHTVLYSQWTVTCCNILDRQSNQDNDDDGPVAKADRTLVWLVRLGNILEETTGVNFKRKGVDDRQHLQLMYKGLEAQLREWQGQMPSDLLNKREKNLHLGPRPYDLLESEKDRKEKKADKRSPPTAVLRISNWFTEIILYGQPLLKFPSRPPTKARPAAVATTQSPRQHMDAERLLRCTHILRLWFDYVMNLPPSGFISFTAIEWSYFVITIILGLKLSFPLPHDCPSWDHAAARQVLNMGSFFEKFATLGGAAAAANTTTQITPSASSIPGSTSNNNPNRKRAASATDVLSASKVVVGVVQNRYERRLAALEKVEAAKAAAASKYRTEHMMQQMTMTADGSGANNNSLRSCPMFDGSMDPYLESWDDTFVNTLEFATPALVNVPTVVDSGYFDNAVMQDEGRAPGTSASASIQQTGFHDLWATMTMGWGQSSS